jgi:hypothetical protein
MQRRSPNEATEPKAQHEPQADCAAGAGRGRGVGGGEGGGVEVAKVWGGETNHSQVGVSVAAGGFAGAHGTPRQLRKGLREGLWNRLGKHSWRSLQVQGGTHLVADLGDDGALRVRGAEVEVRVEVRHIDRVVVLVRGQGGRAVQRVALGVRPAEGLGVLKVIVAVMKGKAGGQSVRVQAHLEAVAGAHAARRGVRVPVTPTGRIRLRSIQRRRC